MGMVRFVLVPCVILLLACSDKEAEERPGGGHMPGGMAGMRMDSAGQGGHMGMESMRMMPGLRQHLDSMMRMPPAQLSRMVATHDRMMSHMMDRMGADMRGMSMGANAEWEALTDSVKADLADLPALEGQALSGRMKAHGDRVERLLGIHEQMMKGM